MKLAVVLDVALVALGGAIANRVAERRRQHDAYARRWWGAELLLLACILALAGLLGSLVPRPDRYGRINLTPGPSPSRWRGAGEFS